jgi:hypothetical protein
MNRSTHYLEGSPGFTFSTKKQENGKYHVTTESLPGKVWESESEVDAIREATKEMQDRCLRGES